MGTVIALDFPAARARTTSAPHGDGIVIGTVSPSRDRIAAAIEKCPSLGPLRAACGSADPDTCIRRERILASLLELLPSPPRAADEQRVSYLCNCSYADVYRMEGLHVENAAPRRLHLTLMPAWDHLFGLERYFAQRCAVALVDTVCVQPHDDALTA